MPQTSLTTFPTAPPAVTATAPPAVAAGIDVGGTTLHVALVTDSADVLITKTVPTEPTPQTSLETAAAVIADLCANQGLNITDLTGIGVGIPGLVAPDGTVRHAVNLGIGSEPYPLASTLAALTNLPVQVNNDVNVGALGLAFFYSHHTLEMTPEHYVSHINEPSGEKLADLAYVAIGTGLGVGMILNGRLRQGVIVDGEIGHIPIDPAGPQCGCGQRGCIEMYASGSAAARLWPHGKEGEHAAAALFRAASAGDPAAIAARNTFCDGIATAIRVIVLTMGVHCVVLGGGVRDIGEVLMDEVKRALERDAETSRFIESLDLISRVDLVPQGVPTGAIGAAALLLVDLTQPLPTPSAMAIRPASVGVTAMEDGSSVQDGTAVENSNAVRPTVTAHPTATAHPTQKGRCDE
ncbi:MAG: ROK family protein [Cellulomonadaceae bacterium]|nr:ROK family protein [Cellulomonadaceae bacterium]